MKAETQPTPKPRDTRPVGRMFKICRLSELMPLALQHLEPQTKQAA